MCCAYLHLIRAQTYMHAGSDTLSIEMSSIPSLTSARRTPDDLMAAGVPVQDVVNRRPLVFIQKVLLLLLLLLLMLLLLILLFLLMMMMWLSVFIVADSRRWWTGLHRRRIGRQHRRRLHQWPGQRLEELSQVRKRHRCCRCRRRFSAPRVVDLRQRVADAVQRTGTRVRLKRLKHQGGV